MTRQVALRVESARLDERVARIREWPLQASEDQPVLPWTRATCALSISCTAPSDCRLRGEPDHLREQATMLTVHWIVLSNPNLRLS